jgi:hypothetical protein
VKPEFVRCEFCRVKIPEKICELSVYRKVIDGRELLLLPKMRRTVSTKKEVMRAFGKFLNFLVVAQ